MSKEQKWQRLADNFEQQLVRERNFYREQLKRIADLPEPLPRKIAKETLKEGQKILRGQS